MYMKAKYKKKKTCKNQSKIFSISIMLDRLWAFQVVLMVKNLLANAGDIRDMGSIPSWVRKIPLEKRMATHSNILAWRTPRTEKPGRLQSMGSQTVRHD